MPTYHKFMVLYLEILKLEIPQILEFNIQHNLDGYFLIFVMHCKW